MTRATSEYLNARPRHLLEALAQRHTPPSPTDYVVRDFTTGEILGRHPLLGMATAMTPAGRFVVIMRDGVVCGTSGQQQEARHETRDQKPL